MEDGMKMKVEIWSDIMCPFCYIGKRNFESALSQLDGNEQIDIEWKSFQLDPSIPERQTDKMGLYEYLAERKGTSLAQSVAMHNSVVETAKRAGLEYNFDRAIVANSFKAHCLIQLAKTRGLGDAMEERLFRAYFTEGRDVSDPAVLTELSADAGLSQAEVSEAFSNEIYAERVRNDVNEAQRLGLTGVPFFVFDRRYAISGAQPPQMFLKTLQQSSGEWQKEHSAAISRLSEGDSCAPGDADCK